MQDPTQNRKQFISFVEHLAQETELPFYQVLSSFIGENTSTTTQLRNKLYSMSKSVRSQSPSSKKSDLSPQNYQAKTFQSNFSSNSKHESSFKNVKNSK